MQGDFRCSFPEQWLVIEPIANLENAFLCEFSNVKQSCLDVKNNNKEMTWLKLETAAGL